MQITKKKHIEAAIDWWLDKQPELTDNDLAEKWKLASDHWDLVNRNDAIAAQVHKTIKFREDI